MKLMSPLVLGRFRLNLAASSEEHQPGQKLVEEAAVKSVAKIGMLIANLSANLHTAIMIN